MYGFFLLLLKFRIWGVIFCYPIVTERELLEFLFPICFF